MSFPKYQAYKASGIAWLGNVPATWSVLPLKAVATCNDEVLPEGTDGDTAIEYVEISGVEEGRGITQTESLTFAAAPSRARRVVRHGDVLISTVRTYLRAIATVSHPPENLVASTGFAAIRPRSAHPGFLGYLLHCEYLISEVIARSVGISYPAINASDLMRLKGPIPGREEQAAIATFLDRETAKIDALVEEQRRLIELLKEKRQAVMSRAVTKGLDPNVPMKDSRAGWIGEVPQHWRVSALGYVARIDSGSTPDRANPDYWGGNIPWVKTGEVNYDPITHAEECITEAGLQGSSAKIALPGTLLMAMYGQGVTRGRVALLEVPAAYNQACAAIHFDTPLAPAFGRYFFMAAYEHVRDGGNETSQMNLSTGAIQKFKITVPPLPEQLTIVDFLDRSTREIELLMAHADESLLLLSERRSALISAAVTGKIDVRGLVPQREAAVA